MGGAVTGHARTQPLALVGVGAQGPLGLAPEPIAAAVRAGLKRFRETRWLPRAADGSPTTVSLLSTLEPAWGSAERMRRLGIAAALQALAPLAPVWPAEARLPVLISVPPRRPGLEEGAGARIVAEIMGALPIRPDPRLGGMYEGADGGLAALAYAAALVAEGRAEVCLVGGVDSLRDIELLHWLEGLGRLKGPEAPCGLVPGEGAAFLLVCAPSLARRARLAPLARIAAPVEALEPNPWYEGRPCLGEGLTRALHGALEAGLAQGARAEVTWGDLNGEPWRADEWGYAYLRTAERHGEPLRLRHPAEALGDLGAATGPMLVLLAALDLGHPRRGAASALVFAASDTRPHRAACVLTKAEERR
jgi:3-oxoacyl-[acyl-carrier-protein] synthase-1